jgi:outer membrane lipase/esterase
MLFNDRRRRALVSAALAASALLLASCGGSDDTPSLPRQFSQVIVFGASISDTGNACPTATAPCPPVPPYAAGRFSNGPIWIDAVTARYGASSRASGQTGATGTNFAVGGARTGSIRAALDAAGLTTVAFTDSSTPSMVQQFETAIAGPLNRVISPTSLVVLDATTVGNNIAAALTLAGNPANAASAAAIPTAIVTGAVTDVVGLINRIYAAGGRHILILNSPNIGNTPRVQAAAAAAAQVGGAAAAQQIIGGATAMSVGIPNVSPGFNGALAQQVAGLRQLLTGVNIYLVDVGALEAQMRAGTAPGQPALTNITQQCFVPPVAPAVTPTICPTPDAYFYWDDFHPTTAVSTYLGQRAIAALPTP